MALAKIPVDVPRHLYVRLKNSAALAQRSIEDVLASVVAIALPSSPDLPESLASELAEMIWLSDDALWDATNPSFTKEDQKRLSKLNSESDKRSLTPQEKRMQEELLLAYERSVLLRAQAFSILGRRGHNYLYIHICHRHREQHLYSSRLASLAKIIR